MLLPQARVNELLQIFDNPKNILPYNISHQKEEVKNASKFINDYHLYGPPHKYQTYNPNIEPVQQKEIISRNQSINSQNELINKQSTILSHKIQSLQNYEDFEIHQSITNLKSGQKEYAKNKEKKYINNYNNTNYPQNSINSKYDPTIQSISSYEYQKHENILNSILGNSSDLATTQYINDYGQNYINYENFNDYKSNSITNSSIMKAYNYKKLPRLKDIKSNPEDVVITEIPSNLAISMNPLSSSNIGGMGTVPITYQQNNISQIPQESNEKPKIIEEINTDIIPNDEIEQTQKKEEPILIENVEPEKEPEPEVVKEGKYKITELNGPITLPPNYSTDDEDEFNAIQIINQDISSWKLQKDKDNIKIYSKLFKIINSEGKEVDNIVFYTDATINCNASEVNRQLHDLSLRAKYDKSLQKGKILKQEHLSNNIDIAEYYMYIKMPFIFADRDAVIRTKTWNDYLGEKDCFLSHLKSIEHPDYPPKEKPVRAIYENGGQYIKPINENQCKFYSISKFDFKISAPVSMMESSGSDGQFKGIKDFISRCGK